MLHVNHASLKRAQYVSLDCGGFAFGTLNLVCFGCQVPALVSLSLLGEEYLERDIAIALCSLLLTESGSGAVAGGPGQKNILDMGALGALNSLARSDEEELQVWFVRWVTSGRMGLD
jgi:hypothetical protein